MCSYNLHDVRDRSFAYVNPGWLDKPTIHESRARRLAGTVRLRRDEYVCLIAPMPSWHCSRAAGRDLVLLDYGRCEHCDIWFVIFYVTRCQCGFLLIHRCFSITLTGVSRFFFWRWADMRQLNAQSVFFLNHWAKQLKHQLFLCCF